MLPKILYFARSENRRGIAVRVYSEGEQVIVLAVFSALQKEWLGD